VRGSLKKPLTSCAARSCAAPGLPPHGPPLLSVSKHLFKIVNIVLFGEAETTPSHPSRFCHTRISPFPGTDVSPVYRR
jgi:hypothetical protein